ncbi:MAG: PAS domain S-box protein [Acidobacteria bacterium]|nr:PAS domain S-box protein [Acidobacteriota bacterium]
MTFLADPPTDRLAALELELRRYRELFEASAEGLYRIDYEPPVSVDLPVDEQVARLLASGRAAVANPALARMYGFTSPEELIGLAVADFLDAESPTTRATLEAFVRQGHRIEGFETEGRDRSGRARCFLNAASGIVENGCLVSIWGSQRDLTEEKRTLERLRSSEERFARAFELNPGAISISRLEDGVFVDVNRAFAETIGLPREQLIGRSGHELNLWATPEEREKVVRLVRLKGFARRVPARVRNASGELRRAQISAMPIEIEGRACLLVLAEDVSEIERATEALRRSEALFRAAADGSLDAFFVLEAVRDAGERIVDFSFVDLNCRGERFIGRERSEVIGARLCQLLPVNRQRGYFQRYVQVLETGRVLEEEFLVSSPGQRERWLRHQVVPLEDGVAIWTRDVTERRQAAEERRRLELGVQNAQRLESLGVLAGGVAHDFNNLLTGIQGYADLARRKAGTASPVAPLLEEILLGVRRAADLTQKMLAFAGGGQLDLEWVALNEAVSEMVELVQVGFPERCRLELALARPGPGLEADPTQLRQVALNLIMNATEALGAEGGSVVVTTGETTCDGARLERSVLGRERDEGRYAFLRVADEGCGMSEEVRHRIFDPFFSTKFTGRGLGMAAVLGIVRAHRGAIEIDSAPGQGSVVTVLLPLAMRPARAGA